MPSLTFNFLDIGQGDGTYIEFPNGTNMLIDLGSRKNSKIITPSVLEFFDKHTKIGAGLETLLLTHGDEDHYNLIEDAFVELKVNPKVIYIGGEVDDYKGLRTFLNKRIKRVKLFEENYSSGVDTWDGIDSGSVKVYVLKANNPARVGTNTNAKSVVLLFEYKGHKVILGGDATKATEKAIIKTYKDLDELPFLQSDYMKVNHHGSETSSCSEWLSAIQPKYAFVSADMHESYLLPRCTIITRILKECRIASFSNHPYICYDKGKDDWKNIDSKSAIFNTLCKYVVTEPDQGSDSDSGPEEDPEVIGHGVRYTLDLKSTGDVSITNSGYPKTAIWPGRPGALGVAPPTLAHYLKVRHMLDDGLEGES